MTNPATQQAFFVYVEDDAASRKVMELMMHKAIGTTNLTVFENSQDFIARLKSLSNRPDVVMLDIHVKPHDGFEMLQLLRAEPDYEHIKVIALTASVTNEEIELLRTSGFDGAIGKPLGLSTFPNLLDRVLKGEAVWFIT
jgi:CheY-like chemotaxis protein